MKHKQGARAHRSKTWMRSDCKKQLTCTNTGIQVSCMQSSAADIHDCGLVAASCWRSGRLSLQWGRWNLWMHRLPESRPWRDSREKINVPSNYPWIVMSERITNDFLQQKLCNWKNAHGEERKGSSCWICVTQTNKTNTVNYIVLHFESTAPVLCCDRRTVRYG